MPPKTWPGKVKWLQPGGNGSLRHCLEHCRKLFRKAQPQKNYLSKLSSLNIWYLLSCNASLKAFKRPFSPMENNRLELCKFKEICCLYFLSTGGERNPQNWTKSHVQPACRVRFWEHRAQFCILKSLFISIILQKYRILLNDNILIFILRWVFLVFKGKWPLKYLWTWITSYCFSCRTLSSLS